MKIVQMTGLLGILYLTGCTVKGNSKENSRDPELPVLQLDYKDTLLHRSYVASINAFQNVELRAKAAGFLEEVLVDEGQLVKKGQVLFKLNDAEFKVQLSEASASLASAHAEIKAAEVELMRVNTLVGKKVLSASELDLAKAKLAMANAKAAEASAQQEKAQIRLSYTLVRAPFNGIIDRIPHKRGSLIAEGSLLTTVSDIHTVHVYFNVSENEYLHYVKSGQTENRIGQSVNLILADGSTYPFPGKIETMESEFEPATGSIAFRASFPNPAKLLKHGASGKVMLTAAVPNALMIPQRSVFEIQDKNYVFVVNKDNTVRMKSFVPERRVEDFVLVKSGLTDEDKIIYEGVQNIREGNKVVPRLISMEELQGE
ncbi:efflux RND transporter periplasmic adaptor subunit [Paraflavitalea soli]|uniref:Efflux RND transporter periplasmic adaptor subunit n=1 Tax=Paraflavitalea soli TaxID=2315862 RepID=A0A3B7MES4_9BACT|nr:efflux RND transporter periplasmic adaptor subunit [Paraflavitalea soli]AXY72802.1 efflux RND transporter periplasmic adaptor subunit [Paraflavitalea soli]